MSIVLKNTTVAILVYDVTSYIYLLTVLMQLIYGIEDNYLLSYNKIYTCQMFLNENNNKKKIFVYDTYCHVKKILQLIKLYQTFYYIVYSIIYRLRLTIFSNIPEIRKR